MTLDPVRFEVIRHALLAATEEMALALRRSAYSTNIKTRADFSCAFFDRDLELVAPAFTQPIHLGSLVELVPRAVRAFGLERLEPGDIQRLRIDLPPISNLFAAGHRIRIDVSSSNFPRFDVNPNTGEPLGRHTHAVVAENAVHMDAEHRSHALLPVVPAAG